MTSDLSLRAFAKDLLDRRTTRRTFIQALVSAGASASAARAAANTIQDRSSERARGEIIEATGGEVMVRSLKAASVEFVFGIPGTDEVGFIDALADHPEIKYVLGLHEGPIAAMADGYAKVSGRAAFVNVHTVAGTVNVLGQLVNSSLDGTPVIFTAGNQDTRLRGRGSFLDAPQLDTLPHTYTKWGWDVLRADTIPDVVRRAFKLASTPPDGPVFLTFSKDIWKEERVKAEILSQKSFSISADIVPPARLIDEAANLLVNAESPVLLAGDEIAKYGGREHLVKLAEMLAAPVVGELATGHGRINFPTLHPQYLGLFPGQKQFALPIDVFFNAGGRMFSEFDYDSEPILSRSVKTVHMSIDTANLGRTYPADVAILANPVEGMKALAERVRSILPAEKSARQRSRLPVIAQAKAAINAAKKRALEQEWESAPVSPARLAAELNQALDPNAIVLTELVTSDAFHADYIDYNNGTPGRTHIASHGGVLGWGIGAACGAKLAAPDREVVLLSGDGSFHFGIQGLWTAARYEIPVLFVVWNNVNFQSNRLGLVKHGGRAAETGRYIGTYLGDPEVDHTVVAQGYGVTGARVNTSAELKPALARALAFVRGGKPFVLEVRIKRRFKGADIPWYEKFSVAQMRTRERS